MRLIKSTEQPVEVVSHDADIEKTVLLAAGIVPAITQLATTAIAPCTATHRHSHRDMAEVFVVLAGNARAQIGDRDVSLEAGDCLVVEPGETHMLSNIGAIDLRLLYFGVRVI